MPIPFLLSVRHAIAEKLVFRRLRDLYGGRIRCAVTGGAPLSKELLKFFHAAGILILEGYGLTECLVQLSTDLPTSGLERSAGRSGVEIKIAEDGEILLRSPIVFSGYFKDPREPRNPSVTTAGTAPETSASFLRMALSRSPIEEGYHHHSRWEECGSAEYRGPSETSR